MRLKSGDIFINTLNQKVRVLRRTKDLYWKDTEVEENIKIYNTNDNGLVIRENGTYPGYITHKFKAWPTKLFNIFYDSGE